MISLASYLKTSPSSSPSAARSAACPPSIEAARSHQAYCSGEGSATSQPRSRRIDSTSAPVKGFAAGASEESVGSINMIVTYGCTRRRAVPLRAQLCNSARLAECSNNVRRDGFAAPDRVNAFIGLGFQMNFFRANAQRLCQRLAHLREVRSQLGLFRNHHRIDVLDREMLFIQQLFCMFQEEHAVRALPLWIGVRKIRSDVAEPRRTQQRIAKRMRQHVPVRVPHRSFVKRQLNPPNDERPPLFQPVQIIPNSSSDRSRYRNSSSSPFSLHLPHQEETESH